MRIQLIEHDMEQEFTSAVESVFLSVRCEYFALNDKNLITKTRNVKSTKSLLPLFRGVVLSCFRDEGFLN